MLFENIWTVQKWPKKCFLLTSLEGNVYWPKNYLTYKKTIFS